MMGVRSFINPDLTDEEKEEMKADMDTQKEEMKSLFESIRDAKKAGEDTTELEAQIQENMIEGLSILDRYIDEEKTEKWEEYKDKMVETIENKSKTRVRPDANMRRGSEEFQGSRPDDTMERNSEESQGKRRR